MTTRRKPTGQPSSDNAYNAFYQTFADEVHRLSGRSGNELNIIDFMEDEPLQRAYRDR